MSKKSKSISEVLKEKSFTLRNSIESELRNVLEKVIQSYSNSVQEENTSNAQSGVEVEIDGYLQLRQNLIHKHASEDFEDNHCIDAIHTNWDRKTVSIRLDGDNSDENLSEISNENLIAIIEDLEYFIDNPNEIEII